eukprot:TRINITY_DN483_c0_g4_i2.p1 TRINITY_DN483_c0_g4~~TRINITY_DN483_c0_g4_i2.p1  ORF type:complete len:677 (+),score=131.12 TRINITY_DN483_c0_g4_i2:97-2127(+)
MEGKSNHEIYELLISLNVDEPAARTLSSKLKKLGYETVALLKNFGPSLTDMEQLDFSFLEQKIVKKITEPTDIQANFVSLIGFPSNTNLEVALQQTLNNRNLILDEIQYLWESNHILLQQIVQIVEGIKPRPPYKLVLLGTPRIGDVEVNFEEHTRGRLARFIIPSLSGIEIFAILRKLHGMMDFNVFLTLWSCFDGIPGLYELASQSLVFTSNSYDEKKLLQLVSESVILQNSELEWIFKAKNGYEIKDVEKSDQTLIRLKELNILTQSEKKVYVKDKVVISYLLASNNDLPIRMRINNMRGYGLETLTRSVALEIFEYYKLEDYKNYDEISRGGFGEMDIDGIYQNITEKSCSFFSCKVDPYEHAVSFMDNINKYFCNIRPRKIYLFLCSPFGVDVSIVNHFVQERRRANFKWNPFFKIYSVNLSEVIQYYSSNKLFVSNNTNWPILDRTIIRCSLNQIRYPLIHVIGTRRVGKTTLVEEAFNKNQSIFIDFKKLNLQQGQTPVQSSAPSIPSNHLTQTPIQHSAHISPITISTPTPSSTPTTISTQIPISILTPTPILPPTTTQPATSSIEPSVPLDPSPTQTPASSNPSPIQPSVPSNPPTQSSSPLQFPFFNSHSTVLKVISAQGISKSQIKKKIEERLKPNIHEILEELIRSGEIVTYEKDGIIYYSNND